MTPKDALRRGATYLRRVQNDDGGFDGLASPSASNFSRAQRHPTVFFTALILSALQEVPNTATTRQAAAAFLLRHKSPAWSWNYWVRDDRAATLRSYPDDLDDTMCALAALGRYDASLIDGAVLAEVAGQLIATEQAPGGPYRTWLVEPTAAAVWQDVDIAVNANIGGFLWQQDVRLPELEAYIAEAIQRQDLSSPYYVGVAPTLYFLSRWYRGAGAGRLQALAMAELQQEAAAVKPEALTLALLVTAAVQLAVPTAMVEPAIRQLRGLQRTDGSWPAAGLYYEPPVKGIRHYAGSPALTTALSLEALMAYRRHRLAAPSQTPVRVRLNTVHELVVEQALACTNATNDPDLRRLYRQQLTALAERDHDRQITGMATVTTLACGRPIDAETLLHLNIASLQGWLSYTIYDDIWDNEGDPRLLGVANIAMRHCLASFAKAQTGPAFKPLVTQALEWVDGANTWEAVRARGTVTGSTVTVERLPDYGDYRQLARRSWGHSLASRGVLLAGGSPFGEKSLPALERFFHHFLIAKQLSDDAHDWEEDLCRGRITAVVALLLGDPPPTTTVRLRLSRSLPKLRQRFWSQTIVQVADLVHVQVEAARKALADCAVLAEPAEFHSWLDRLEQGVDQALTERAQAQQFIACYRQGAGR